MGRAPCYDHKTGVKKGAWTAEEDAKLVSFIQRNNGHGCWRTLPRLAGLQRCGKSCRLRWTNYLRPNIKRGNFSPEEEHTIIQLHTLMGNGWSSIASHLPGRTDNEVKNHWNTRLKKRLSKMGIDPATHLPDSPSTIITHMAQWELARMEAEARLSARGRADARYTATCGRRLIDHYLKQNCLRGEEISIRAAHSYMALQNWENSLRNQATALSTHAPFNGTNHYDAFPCSSSSSSSPAKSSHELFQTLQGGDLDNQPDSADVGMPAHDYGNQSIRNFTGSDHLISSQSTTTPESSNLSLLSDLLSPSNGVPSDYLFALSSSPQSCDDNQDYWANMLNLVDFMMPCQC